MSSMMLTKNIVLGVTGGIAAYKACSLLRLLQKQGHVVKVVMTQAATEFVSPLTFQALSGFVVHTQLLNEKAEAGMGHIELAKWADLMVIAPATANFLAKCAHGFADDLLSTIVLATAAPVVFAPAMNQQMYAQKITQNNIKALQSLGHYILPPSRGVQACGDIGEGRLPEPEEIVEYLNQHYFTLTPLAASTVTQALPTLIDKHVVITAGPTQEPIDPVRYISNHSSGKMGYALATQFALAGAKVTLISGPVALATPQGNFKNAIERIDVNTAEQMYEKSVIAVENNAAVFVATAAVADYKVATIAEQKIKKSDDVIHLTLNKNKDIVASIASLPNKPFVLGFAAETQHVEDYAKGKLQAKNLDMIACNDVSRSDIGFGADENAMSVFFAEQYRQAPLYLSKASKCVIAEQLVKAIAEVLV